MKNTKRIFALILAVLMLLASSACTGTTEPDATNEETTVFEKEGEIITSIEETSKVPEKTDTDVIELESTAATETNQITTTEQTVITETPETTKEEELDNNKYRIKYISDFAYNCHLAVISTDVGYGYISTSGEIVIEPIYEEAYDFRGDSPNQLALVKKDGKYGYIDMEGNVLVDFVYDSAEADFNVISRVSLDGKEYFIYYNDAWDRVDIVYTFTGNEVATGDFSNGYFWVQTKEELISGTKYYLSYYDSYGRCSAKIEDGIPCINNGVDYSSINSKFHGFYYDNTGLMMISVEGGYFHKYNVCSNSNTKRPIEISKFKPISQNYFIYEYGWNNAEYYYWDGDGFLKPSVDYFNSTSWIFLGNDYYYCKRGDQYGSSGNVILYKDEVILELDKISDFSGASIVNVAYRKRSGSNYFGVHLKSPSNIDFYSLIDDKGNVIIKPTKDACFMTTYTEVIGIYIYTRYNMNYIVIFTSGATYIKAQDTQTGLWGYIDFSGNWVVQPQYMSVSDYMHQGVFEADGNKIIDSNGKVIFDINALN